MQAIFPPRRLRTRRLPLSTAMAAALAMGATSHAPAATQTWTGGGSNNNWSTPGNWDSPALGDTLVFGGTTRLSNTNDYSGRSVTGITFAAGAGAFVLGGQPLFTSGAITNRSSNLQTLNFDVFVQGNPTWDGGTGGMNFGGTVRLGSSALSLVNGVSVYGTSLTLNNQSSSIGSGSKMSVYDTEIGTTAGSTGTITVSGTGSQLTTRNALSLGWPTTGSGSGTGTGTVNILNSGKVTTEYLFIGSKGTLNLSDGALQIRTFVGNAGGFNWNGGTLAFMGDAALGAGLLAGTTILGSNKALSAANNLTLGTGTSLQVNGGALSAGTLTLDGGTLRTSAAATTAGALNWVKGDLQLTSAAEVGTGILPYSLTLGTGKNLGVTDGLTVGLGRTLQLSGGSLNLNGSRLTLNGGSFLAPGATNIGGALDWTLGSVSLTGNATLGAGLLASQIDLIANMYLDVSNNLTIGTGSALSMKGGTLRAQTLTLDGGTFYAPYGINGRPAALNWVKGAITLGEDAALGFGLLPSTMALGTGKTLNIAKNLTIGNGASLQHSGGVLNAATLTLDGGTFQTSSTPSTGGAFNWIRGALGLTSDAALGAGLLAGDTTVGAGKSLGVSGNLSVGTGTTLQINDAGALSAGKLTLDGGTVQAGSVANTGGVFDWIKGTLGISNGSLGAGLLQSLTTLGAGKTLNANNLSVGSGTTLRVDGGTLAAVNLALDGGMLRIGGGSATTGGVFNWIRGTLGFSGDASLGTGLLKKTTVLTDGQALDVANTLTVGAGRTLVLDGGQVSAGRLALAGGSFLGGGDVVDLSRIGTVAGHGTVLGKLRGNADNTITATGGALTLGDTDAVGGYAFGGTLDVGSQQVVLLSADKAQLGVATRLAAGGNLSTVNGANLAAGNTLSFSGDSSIQGHFTNNGSVAGSAGTLSFVNDVDGAGSYAGNVLFKAAFNPGNSPASVSYHGGNVSFDSASVLTMELLGDTGGAQYDQLVDMHTLSFNGTLKLVFGSGFVPLAGSSFVLFDFDNFSGSFGTAANGYDRITVAGYDRSKLDFSRLAIDGRLGVVSVTPVPEPETYAMLLAGLGMVAAVTRRRRQAGVRQGDR